MPHTHTHTHTYTHVDTLTDTHAETHYKSPNNLLAPRTPIAVTDSTPIGYRYGSPDTLYYKCVRTECSQLQYGQESVETRCEKCSCYCTSNCLTGTSLNVADT